MNPLHVFSTLFVRVLIYLVLYLFIRKKQGLCERFFRKALWFLGHFSGEGRLKHDRVVIRPATERFVFMESLIFIYAP